MSVKYAAQGSVVSATSPWRKVTISSVSNTTPIALAFNFAHDFNQTDSVLVEGTGISAIDGAQFQVNVVDSTHVQLLGTTASGTSSSGYAIDMQLQPAGVFPSGGELGDPNVLGAALEWAGNPAPFLYQRCGQYSFFQGYYAFGGNALNTGLFFNAGWYTFSSLSSHAWTLISYYTLAQIGINNVPPYVKGTDAFEFETSLSLCLNSVNNTDQVALAFGLFFVQGGSIVAPASSPFCTTIAQVSTTGLAAPGGSYLIYEPVMLRGFVPNVTLHGGGGLTLPDNNFGIGLAYLGDGNSSLAGGSSLKAVGPWTLSGAQYRAN